MSNVLAGAAKKLYQLKTQIGLDIFFQNGIDYASASFIGVSLKRFVKIYIEETVLWFWFSWSV